MRLPLRSLATTLLLAMGCAQPSPRPEAAPPPNEKPAAVLATAPAGPPRAVTAAPAAPPSGQGCGPLHCRREPNVEASVARLISQQPLVIAFGEAHAQAEQATVETATARFTRDLLPMFKGRASDLVLELMVSDGGCEQGEVQEFQQHEAEVTRSQSATNKNEFVMLAQRASELGIRPHVLRPTCAQFREVTGSGAADIDAMLSLVADLTADLVAAILNRNALRGAPGMVLTYGGLVHNDPEPRVGRETWSFAAPLIQLTRGRYLAVDLVVREYIQDTDTWKSLPWVRHFEGERYRYSVVSFEPTPSETVIVFPQSPPAPPPSLPASDGAGGNPS